MPTQLGMHAGPALHIPYSRVHLELSDQHPDAEPLGHVEVTVAGGRPGGELFFYMVPAAVLQLVRVVVPAGEA